MPFGPYADFNDCITKNSSKASPEGFCAWLHHQITGAWPSQLELAAPMPQEAWEIYLKEYAVKLSEGIAEKDAHEAGLSIIKEKGWLSSPEGWIRMYAAPAMRNVQNVRIFATGTWTDSMGTKREWAGEDLDKMVQAFNDGVPAIVALKAGHTPDSFNEEVAKELGVPVKVVTGDLGSGQISLGKMVSMERRGDALFSSFDHVPEGIASLIEGGQFSTVSVEIEDKIGNYGPVITAVAMLGAEEPAVDIATLDRALVFGGKREGVRILSFSLDVPPDKLKSEFDTLRSKMNDTIKGMRGAPIFRALMVQLTKLFEQMSTSKHKEGDMEITKYQMSPEEQLAITTALGIPPEATFADILTAIEALKVAPPPGEAPAEEQKAEFSKMSKRVKELEHKDLVHEYTKATALLYHIEGKSEDIAEKLATLEETAGKESAKSVLTTYQSANDIAEKATKAIGTAKPGEKTLDFEAEVTEYSKSHLDTARAECYKIVMVSHPDLYRASVAENRNR